MIDTKLLKQKILDLAIRGKLVPQDPNDEPASVLLERIRAEKERLVAEGKIKRSKSTTDNRHYQNVPFEIPMNWQWVQLGEIYLHNTGKALNSKDNEGDLRDYITTSNLYWNHFELGEVRQMLFTKKEMERCLVTKGDLLVCEGGDVGRAAIWNYDYDICIQNHIHRLRGILPLCQEFYYYVFYLYKFTNRIGGRGTALQGLSSDSINRLLIPLPPFTEQKRIVADIKKWFNWINEIEDNKLKLQETVKQAKSKILSLAISGKLVAQDPTDEPAIELLKRINPKFIPCDTSHYGNIPQGWCICKLKQVTTIARGGSPRPIKSYITTAKDGVNWIKIGDAEKGGKYINHTEQRIIPEGVSKSRFVKKGDFLLSNSMSFGRPYILNIDGCIHDGWLVISPTDNVYDKGFLYYLLSSQYAYNQFVEQASGTAVSNLNIDRVANALFPVPPINEQLRIVQQIEQIIGVLDRIATKL